MKKVKIFEKSWCPYCQLARNFFESNGLEIEAIDVEQDSTEYEELKEQYDMHTVPMIFIGEYFVGGFSDLMDLKQKGELDGLLNE